MKISRLLDRKGSYVATVRPNAAIIDAVRELAKRSIGALVVSDDGRGISGIVSERDVVRAISQFGSAILDSPVRMIMSEDLFVCSPDDVVDSLMSTMTDHRIRHIPVLCDGALSGIVSIGDLVKTRLDELELEREALKQYITAR
ncbi:MAG TPA: CBS domain-containing protein [Acidimicrobiales bacterium]|nr:CBS domain-containing protein [Acidimicrobiales bacterium]